MTIRFKDIVDTVETIEEVSALSHCQQMEHLFAVGKRGREAGDIFCPRGVAIDSNTTKFMSREVDIIVHACKSSHESVSS